MAHFHVYSWSRWHVDSSSVKQYVYCWWNKTKFWCKWERTEKTTTLDSTSGWKSSPEKFTTDTSPERERRLEIQREQRRRRRRQETTEQREHRLAQRKQNRQQETEEQRNRRLEYQRQYRQGRRESENLADRQRRLNLDSLSNAARLNNENPNKESIDYKDFEQPRHIDWVMRMNRSEMSG